MSTTTKYEAVLQIPDPKKIYDDFELIVKQLRGELQSKKNELLARCHRKMNYDPYHSRAEKLLAR